MPKNATLSRNQNVRRFGENIKERLLSMYRCKQQHGSHGQYLAIDDTTRIRIRAFKSSKLAVFKKIGYDCRRCDHHVDF